MELRLLSTDAERQIFARRLVEARATKGAGFSETKRSLIGEVHLKYGRLYALCDEQSANPNEMIAGFAVHDLATFPQSYPKPDLSHLPPESVLECGELWAIAAGGARLARHAGSILAGILQAQALLVYPILKPWNLSYMYTPFNRIGEPIEWPYIRTLEGGKIFVQAMVLEGNALQRTVEDARSFGYEAIDEDRLIRFNSPFPICSRQLEERRNGGVWRRQPAAVPAPLERVAA